MSRMADDIRFLLWLLLLLLSSSFSCFGSQEDIQCLKEVQKSVIDPNGLLESSWIFENGFEVSICNFTGVVCWHPNENRILSLRLRNLGLQGQFPKGLQNCSSLISLDLSSNKFSGPIPTNIARQLPFITYLNLSYNSFSGEIPVSISNMTYLDTLSLQHNQLSGQILGELGRLQRLMTFNVADNQLSGPIPPFLIRFSPSDFARNQGLSGPPLRYCGGRSKWWLINDESSIGGAAGFVVGFVVAFYCPHLFVFSERLHPFVVQIWPAGSESFV